jgi:uncharacterized OsmC-like protein
MTSKITYLGELRTSSIHIQSGTEILSDAPTDNHGKGEAFSPTDTVANALGACMISIMGIKAMQMDLKMEDSTVEVTKVMQAEPRMIAKIGIVINMNMESDEKIRTIFERAAMTCPVFLSLHPDIEKDVVFNW